MPQIDFYLIARTDPSAPGPGRRQRTVPHQKGHLQGTLLDFGGRFALEPPRGNQHRQAARARLATEKPAVLRRHIPVWPVREAAACGLPEAERAAIVGRSRRFGLSGRAGISSKCEIQVRTLNDFRPTAGKRRGAPPDRAAKQRRPHRPPLEKPQNFLRRCAPLQS